MPAEPDALIFDFDGTLVESSDLHFAAISAAVARQGGAIARSWYDARTGLGRRDLCAAFAAGSDDPPDIERLVADSLAETGALVGMVRPNPPVVALARRFSGWRPMAVATNGESQVVTPILSATGLEKLFDTVVSVDQVKAPKPAPDLFLTAAARLGVAPVRCLVLEDSAEGLAAAKAAGMTALDVRRAETLVKIAALSPTSAHVKPGPLERRHGTS